MGENSKIEWTTHTFNPWIGCTRVSPACENCYAETFAGRFNIATWGTANAGGTRKVTSVANWRLPLVWNEAAHQEAVRARVFCASLSDVFEDFAGRIIGKGLARNAASLDYQRGRLFDLVERCEHLDFLLLTKRPENIRRMIPASWRAQGVPPNVWLGTTVEDQARADIRIDHLLETEAVVHFLSMEPLLGAVDVRRWLGRINWVIGGGESGSVARPTEVGWARSLRDQCAEANVAFFFKQWGNNAQVGSTENLVRLRTKNEKLLDGVKYHAIPTPRPARARRTAYERILAEG